MTTAKRLVTRIIDPLARSVSDVLARLDLELASDAVLTRDYNAIEPGDLPRAAPRSCGLAPEENGSAAATADAVLTRDYDAIEPGDLPRAAPRSCNLASEENGSAAVATSIAPAARRVGRSSSSVPPGRASGAQSVAEQAGETGSLHMSGHAWREAAAALPVQIKASRWGGELAGAGVLQSAPNPRGGTAAMLPSPAPEHELIGSAGSVQARPAAHGHPPTIEWPGPDVGQPAAPAAPELTVAAARSSSPAMATPVQQSSAQLPPPRWPNASPPDHQTMPVLLPIRSSRAGTIAAIEHPDSAPQSSLSNLTKGRVAQASGAAIAGALDPVMAAAAEIAARGGTVPAAHATSRSAAFTSEAAAPSIQNNFHVTVALDRTMAVGEEQALKDALVQVLQDSARRQGLAV